MYAVGRNCRQPQLAARLVEFLLTDPEAIRILGRTRGLPASRAAMAQLRAEESSRPLEVEAHAQVAAQREAGRIPLPAPLFEHPRMNKFMREVFETVAYGKSDAPTAARRLREGGQALLQRLEGPDVKHTHRRSPSRRAPTPIPALASRASRRAT
jgi:oligogalacturonide transport system substrate-binding protein